MEAHAKYTYVGLALIALVVAAVTAVIWLNRTGSRADFNYYTIYFERQPLDGLQIGADVDMRGIKIGRVEDYALLADKINRVRVTIRTDRRAPVRTNTVAIVTRSFVTGIAKISLVTPEPAGDLLTGILPDQNFPVIAEGEDSLDALAGKFNRLGDVAADTLENFNDILQPRNRAALAASMKNLRELTDTLIERSTELEKTLVTFNTAAVQVGRAGSNVAALAESANGQLTPAIRQTEQTMKDVSAAAASLEQQVTSIAQNFGDASSTTDEQLTVAVNELRSTIEATNRLFERLQDPRAALFGTSKSQRGPGE
jgi:phospholipid/cholesterol/gamma-HCH transport system substrate-binding protein